MQNLIHIILTLLSLTAYINFLYQFCHLLLQPILLHLGCMDEKRNAYEVSVQKHAGKSPI